MKLILTTDEGDVLDSCDVSARDFVSEQNRYPHGILSLLEPGTEALLKDDPFVDLDDDLDEG